MFPFYFTLAREIELDTKSIQQRSFVKIVMDYLRSKNVDDLYVTDNLITFRRGVFTWSTNVFALVEKPSIALRFTEHSLNICYKFRLIWFWIMALLFTTIAFFFGPFKLLAAIVFLLFGVLNFIICYIKQLLFIKDLAYLLENTES